MRPRNVLNSNNCVRCVLKWIYTWHQEDETYLQDTESMLSQETQHFIHHFRIISFRLISYFHQLFICLKNYSILQGRILINYITNSCKFPWKSTKTVRKSDYLGGTLWNAVFLWFYILWTVRHFEEIFH